MKQKAPAALAVLAVTAFAGCGGGNDSGDNSNQPAKNTTSEPTKLKGARTEANVVRTLGLKKQGNGYIIATSGCKVKAIAYTKSGVQKLEGSAKKGSVIKNDSGTAGIQLDKASYFCAIQAATHVKRIP